jgi:hypothetical protein
VAVLVVDPLEVVDVDHDHGHRRVAVARLDRQIAVEPAPVAHARQAVAQRQLGEVPVAAAADRREDPESGTDRGENGDPDEGEHDGTVRRRRRNRSRDMGARAMDHQRCIGATDHKVEP